MDPGRPAEIQIIDHQAVIKLHDKNLRTKVTRKLAKLPWRYDYRLQAWIVPMFALPSIPTELHPYIPDTTPTNGDPLLLTLLPENMTPYEFQYEQIRNLLTGRWGLWSACGTGKTFMALGAYHILKTLGHVDGMLVVGPEPGRHVWVGEASETYRWLGEPGHYVVRPEPLPESREGVVYVTTAKIWRQPYFTILGDLVRSQRWILVIDECHECSGVLSKRFATLNTWVRYCKYLWCLTATPVRNWPDTFWAIYRFLSGSGIDISLWYDWFCPSGGKKWRNDRLTDLALYCWRFSSTITKEAAASWLPPITETVIRVPMTGRQLKLYSDMVNDSKIKIEETHGDRNVFAREMFVQMTHLQSLASHPLVSRDTAWQDHDIAKLERLEAILAGVGEEKTLIWSWHPGVLEWLAAKLPGSVQYHGRVNKRDREQAVHRFNNDPDGKIFLGNPSSAGVSLNLGAGTVRVFWDLHWSWVQYHQACERNNRITRKLPITSYILISQDSIEEAIWEAINHKSDMSTTIGGVGIWKQSVEKTTELIARWESSAGT